MAEKNGKRGPRKPSGWDSEMDALREHIQAHEKQRDRLVSYCDISIGVMLEFGKHLNDKFFDGQVAALKAVLAFIDEPYSEKEKGDA